MINKPRLCCSIAICAAFGLVLSAPDVQAGEDEPSVNYAAVRTVILRDGTQLTIQRKTHFKGGKFVAITGELEQRRDGTVAIKNTYNYEYDSGLASAQPTSYTSVTLNTNTGRVTVTEWSQAKYWTEDDVKKDDSADTELTSGRRVAGKLASYVAVVTQCYPEPGALNVHKVDFDPPNFLDALEPDLMTCNKWMRTERVEARYYNEQDERENPEHVAGQVAGYQEMTSAVDGQFSDAPDLVIKAVRYDMEYAWAFKHEDDRDLVCRPEASEELIEGFQLTDMEKQNSRSVALITRYTEVLSDNIGHRATRTWSSFVKPGNGSEGDWKGEQGYDKYGRVLEYREIVDGLDGTTDTHRWDIKYWDAGLFEDGSEDTEYGQWFVDSADDAQKRWSYGQVKGYTEKSSFLGGYSQSTLSDRLVTCYDSYGRLLGYEEHSSSDGMSSGVHFDVISYRGEGWISNLMQEYMTERTEKDVTTVTRRRNLSWDEYGRVISYDEEEEDDKDD